MPGEIVLVRHGETAGQSSIRLWGATDVPLAPVGEGQMAKVGAALAGERFDRVVVSPLGRSRTSAQLVLAASRHPPAPLASVEAFREIDFGAWEGLTEDEVARTDAVGHAAWRTLGREFRFPGGESRAEFERRVGVGVAEAFEDPLARGATRILGVLHKGVIKLAIAHLVGLSFAETQRLACDLGSIHRLERGPSGWALSTHNDVAHLSS
jgi:broad specificity phosphatase PhoE